ncbi:carbon-nitrogen hydrolase [Aureococcus anophagefferens]|uniref:Carbon-nitrogen hydrolase n=1 Tax=Aureococcus anophagefferens TaxID=44056 RepID=A0ABR1FU37_AURAN
MMLQQSGGQPAMMRCLFLLVVAASSAVASAQKLTKVAAIQMSMSTSLEANVDKALNLVAEAADDGAKIIVLPELFAARYFAIEENPKCAAVIDADGTVLGAYRKSQLPEDDGWFEKYYFAPGQTGFEVWDTIHGKVGVAICWDQWFPETHRLLTLAGAEVAVFPTAIGFGPVARAGTIPGSSGPGSRRSRASPWPTACRWWWRTAWAWSRRRTAKIAPSRSGATRSWRPRGEIVARGDNASETVVSAVVDLGPNVNRDIWLRDRRVDLYGGLLESDLRARRRASSPEWEPHEAVWLGFPPFLYTNASGPTNRDASAAVCCALADHGVKFLDGGAVLDTAFDGWGYAVAQPADAYFCSSAATEDNVDRLTALALGRETKIADGHRREDGARVRLPGAALARRGQRRRREFPWRGPVDVHGEAVYTYGTGGHVDEVARFAPDGRVLLGVANADARGPLYDGRRARDAANRETLAARGLEVVEIEQPEFLVAKVAPGDGYSTTR